MQEIYSLHDGSRGEVMDITGNTVLVTGGGSGIGLAIAEAFWVRGNQVIICGRNPDKLKKAQEGNPKLAIEILDLIDDVSIGRLANAVKEKYPNLNIVVNNAGILQAYRTEDTKTLLSNIDRELATNLSGPIKLTSLLLPLLKTKERAAVVNVSSILAYIPFVHTPIYSASKAALHFHTLSLRHQLKGTSVQVFELLPPLVDTAMVAGIKGTKMKPEKVARALLRAMKANCAEVRPGSAKFLYAINRIAPGLIRAAFARFFG
jgi:uncharacterized oxidoreductase